MVITTLVAILKLRGAAEEVSVEWQYVFFIIIARLFQTERFESLNAVFSAIIICLQTFIHVLFILLA